MKVTFVGTGDAFGTGGRVHTCIRIDAEGNTLLLDFGAGSIIGWRRLGFSFNDVDAILVTHLHGDHFGGLPFLMLEAQFIEPRSKPLTIMGPPGLRARLSMAMEAFFPGTTGIAYRFPWTVEEVPPHGAQTLAGFDLKTVQVIHNAGAPALAVRVSGMVGPSPFPATLPGRTSSWRFQPGPTPSPANAIRSSRAFPGTWTGRACGRTCRGSTPGA